MRFSNHNLLASRRFVHRTVISTFKNRHRAGEIGLEIEAEGKGLIDAPNPPPPWVRVHDGSLRGDATEYIFANPVKRESFGKAMDILAEYIGENGIQIHDSYRTSVHVHINMQKQKIIDVVKVLALYTCFESLLVNENICGKDRIGNLFCLRYSDAENPLVYLMTGIAECSARSFSNQEGLKYSAVNLATLAKFGSLEFRTMHGTVDKGLLERWVKTLLHLKDYAVNLKSPEEIPLKFSMLGVEGMIREVFQDQADWLLANAPKDAHEEIFDSMQGVQNLCYFLPDWSEPEAMKEEEDWPGLEPPRRNKILINGPPPHAMGRVDVEDIREIRLRYAPPPVPIIDEDI